MSDAGYFFLPWIRRGVGATIAREDAPGSTPAPRATFSVDVSFNAGTLHAKTAELTLYGPGDITGFDTTAVRRMWPAPDVFEAEANFFPLIEFDQADLPWRYTPARRSGRDRLRPWFCLIALREPGPNEAGPDKDEIATYEPAGARGPLAVITVADSKVLPDLGQAWAWAHAQVIGAKDTSPKGIADLLRTAPHQFLARILCPRRLEAKTTYRCFLVPTFERGRLAGIGAEVPKDLDGLEPAWKAGQKNVQIPVYHEWRFQTGGEGDFESLVRRLEARTLPKEIGSRPMKVNDVRAAGKNIGPAAKGPLRLEGALSAVDSESTPWSKAEREPWLKALAGLLNLSTDLLEKDGGTPAVTPPLYGRWHAAARRLSDSPEIDPNPAPLPRWFHELNGDPRLRVAAGLGARVVAQHRESLLASAWEQIDRVRAINEELRLAQLARETATKIHQRDIAAADVESLLQVTEPVHARVRDDDATVRARLVDSPIPTAVLEPAWRRISRRLGPVGRRAGQAGPTLARSTILSRLNDGTLVPAPTPGKPTRLSPIPSFRGLPEGQVPPGGAVRGKDPIRAIDPFFDSPGGGWAPNLENRELTPDDVPGVGGPIGDVLDQFPAPRRPDVKPSADLPRLRDVIVKALDPKNTIEAPVRKRLELHPRLGRSTSDPLDPILAAPEFPQPMYEPLRDLSQDWLLPGIEAVPTDTITLMIDNQRFIEAYMVGLNHEMARVLLFEEYPTDQRGSYFRQFWDVRGTVATTEAEVEVRRDITPIHGWNKQAKLGQNGARAAGALLVLLVRGEVLRRYPGTVIHAAKAELRNGKIEPGKEERSPLFHGTMAPDLTFLGFALGEEEARGDGTSAEPGWFFVVQEQPTAPRFGLDIDQVASPPPRDNLSWKDFASDPSSLTYLGFEGTLPAVSGAPAAVRWPNDPRASDIAFMTLRQPFRVAVHASQMLPPR